jgi:SAM-dependent methyltransferase
MAVRDYSVIASEYYDAALHPTCANFGELSRRYIEPRLFKGFSNYHAILEVGAGKSMVATIIETKKLRCPRLTLLDISREMLAISRRFAEFAELVVADAKSTGLPDAAFDLIVSSLGDPYNTDEFWREVNRLLRPGGACLFTIPAPEWAFAFRSAAHAREAEFVLSSGEIVFVPSFVPVYEEQIRLIENVGLVIENSEEFRSSDLSGAVSPKLVPNLDERNPIVVRGFQIRKTC